MSKDKWTCEEIQIATSVLLAIIIGIFMLYHFT